MLKCKTKLMTFVIKIMTEDKEKFLKKFVEDQFQDFLENFENEFLSWEHFIKHGILFKYINLTQQELNSAFSSWDKTKNLNLDKIKHTPLTEEENKFITDYCSQLVSQHGVLSKAISKFKNQIIIYFNKKNIDFEKLTESEKREHYTSEDIAPDDNNNLFKFLGLTHMQFKYLYQQGKVLV